MATLTRTSINDFSLVNPFYIGASVSAFTVDANGVKTTTLATLYEAPTGTGTLLNPQTLDSEGKWVQPVYIQENVILTVSGVSFDSHDTGVIMPPDSSGDFTTQTGTSNGTTTFTMTEAVDTEAGIIVSLDDFVLNPNSDYTVDGSTTLTFASAPVSGQQIWILFLGERNLLNYVADGSITAAKITNNVLAQAAIRAKLLLLSMALQAASAVAITGGTLDTVTLTNATISTLAAALAVAQGGTGATTAAGARTNLGLGTMAVQSAASVAISGGSIVGITDLAVADGGTGASTASGARSNLAVPGLATSNTFSGGANASTPTAVAYGASIALDLSTGNNFDIGTLTGNLVLANPTNATVGQSGRIKLPQDGTGSRLVTYGTDFKSFGGTMPTATTTASRTDFLYYEVMAANFIFINMMKDIR